MRFLCFTFTSFFFFNVPATTEIYTLSLHDALPILLGMSNVLPGFESHRFPFVRTGGIGGLRDRLPAAGSSRQRSEEHTSELQSRGHLVCRLLLEKKKAHRSCLRTRCRHPR